MSLFCRQFQNNTVDVTKIVNYTRHVTNGGAGSFHLLTDGVRRRLAVQNHPNKEGCPDMVWGTHVSDCNYHLP